ASRRRRCHPHDAGRPRPVEPATRRARRTPRRRRRGGRDAAGPHGRHQRDAERPAPAPSREDPDRVLERPLPASRRVTPETDAAALAARLGCSVEAVALARDAGVIDLHLDTFIWTRTVGYDVRARHAGGPFGRRFGGHVDVPRLADGGVSGGMWSITTNPFRSAARRWEVFVENLAALRALIADSREALAEVHGVAGYRAALARGTHACFLAIQGLHAVEAAPEGVASIPDDCVVRATLVHLTNSIYGGTSSPFGFGGARRLTDAGRDAVRAMNARRMFVDLAHIHESAFWDAVTVHDKTQPLI